MEEKFGAYSFGMKLDPGFHQVDTKKKNIEISVSSFNLNVKKRQATCLSLQDFTIL